MQYSTEIAIQKIHMNILLKNQIIVKKMTKFKQLCPKWLVNAGADYYNMYECTTYHNLLKLTL